MVDDGSATNYIHSRESLCKLTEREAGYREVTRDHSKILNKRHNT